MYEVKPLLHPQAITGISEKTNTVHHDKLYAAYVNKRNEIEQKLAGVDLGSANATYSELRELKAEETLAANGAVLVPIMAMDVYEHTYFIDFSSDHKSYIEAWWQNLNWAAAEQWFTAAVGD